MLNIGKIPYLNCVPFFYTLELKADWNLVEDYPKNLGRLAELGKIDAAPMSLLDSFRLEHLFEPLSNLGIATSGAAESVLLFSHTAISELDKKPISITPESATSVELLRLLLREKYQLKENFVTHEDHTQAQLLIGDQALYHRSKNHFDYVYDLGHEWYIWQNLPFVFARWMVRKDIDTKTKQQLTENLVTSLHYWSAQKKQLAAHVPQQIFDTEKLVQYSSIFNYFLHTPELQGLQRFKEMLP